MKTLYAPIVSLACALAMQSAYAQPKPPLPGMTAPQATKVAAPTAVAAPAATGKLTLIGDGATVLSNDGKLIWMRCSIGQRFEAGQCLGDPKKFDQRDAANELKLLNLSGGFAGSKAWRLPSVTELQSLVFCDQGFSERQQIIKLAGNQSHTLKAACQGESYLRPTIDPILFPNAAQDWTWSSTPDIEKVINVWAINFGSGSPAPIGRHNNQTTVRAVRNAQ